MARRKKTVEPSKRDRFIESLRPLIAKQASAAELYELVYSATRAQAHGTLTWAAAQKIIYDLCGEALPTE